MHIITVWPCNSTPSSNEVIEGSRRKFILLVYKCRHGVAPLYLADELSHAVNFKAQHHLRSASSTLLIIHYTQLSIIGDRAFPVTISNIWIYTTWIYTTAQYTSSGAAFIGCILPFAVPEWWHCCFEHINWVTYLQTHRYITHAHEHTHKSFQPLFYFANRVTL